MNEQLREFMDTLFEDVSKTAKSVELKEEILQNLCDKYEDLKREGKSDQAAYNIAVANVGNITELLENSEEIKTRNLSHESKIINERKRSGLFLSVAVMLYILCLVPVMIFNGVWGVVLMFVLIAIATGLIIYNSMTKNKYVKSSDTVVEDFKEWKEENSEKKSVIKAVNSALIALMLVIYFIISFATGAWHITWVIFLIMGAVKSIVKAIFELKK